MIRALWSWLTGRKAAAEPPQPVGYSPKDDPLVRFFRQQRLQSERARHRIERHRRNPIERTVYPDPSQPRREGR